MNGRGPRRRGSRNRGLNSKHNYHAHRAAGVDRKATLLRKIWVAAGGVCQLCREPVDYDDASRDMRIPLMLGGKPTPDNLQLAHVRCNAERLAEFAQLGQAPALVCAVCGLSFNYRAVVRCYAEPLPIEPGDLRRALTGYLSADKKRAGHRHRRRKR